MGAKLIQEATLTDIANALREKTGTTDLIDPANYAALIRGLNVPSPYTGLINTAVNEGSLESLSWSEINDIAISLVAGGTTREEASGLLGLCKSFTYNSKKTCYAFIVGILQDYYNSTPRGFTFWCVGSDTPFSTESKSLYLEYSFEFSTYQDATGGWGDINTVRKDILRKALQPSGTIYKRMPSEIRSIMKPKTTYYADKASNVTEVSNIEDTMFILSSKELYDINNPYPYITSSSQYDEPWWEYEGTGPLHNEQYQLFAKEGITSSDYSKLINSSYSWLRTISYDSNWQFMLIKSNGGIDKMYADNPKSICPCFCV